MPAPLATYFTKKKVMNIIIAGVVMNRVDDQLISGHLAFQNEKAPDLHFWTIAGAVQFGLAHKI